MSQINPSRNISGGPLAPEIDYMLRDQALMSAAKNYFAWQARLALPKLGRRVLEIGCGTGNFTQHLLDRELVIALDHEPQMLERVRSRFSGAGNLRTVLADAEDADAIAELARLAPDSCVCLNVLEHIRDDAAALIGMSRAIRSDGAIVLIVPAFPSLYGPVDRKLGHFRRYTTASLTRTAMMAGLSVKEMRYFNAAGFFGWWLNARLFKREAQSAGQIAFFDRWIVPAAARMEKIARPPFGQSLLAVLAASRRIRP
jgi:SAM-dependent methyltransferase